ncbi:L-serine ammonia-lyase [Mesorhizobium sp. M7A.F.Ca.US.006.01.1.1]|nr:L-serine ammonia-lyase [Mesorhizobium sp. M7A.F.Ca.US.006.01.1.1]
MPVTTGVFDMFKIGIGPSSSHTMGPMNAARAFAERLLAVGTAPAKLRAAAMGSLAWTGVGHRTDKAILLGLSGFRPDNFDAEQATSRLAAIDETMTLCLAGVLDIPFDPLRDLVLDKKTRAAVHPNTMRFEARDEAGALVLAEDWISPGGGFVRCLSDHHTEAGQAPLRHSFSGGADLLALARAESKSFAEIARENELARIDERALNRGIDRIIETMFACIEEGLEAEGTLPGGLNVRRRARSLFTDLEAKDRMNQATPTRYLDYVAAFAMAVNEVNASGGRVVTAPTNGAAGVVPATLRYYRDFCSGSDQAGLQTFLLTSAVIGTLIKHRASISGAEVGCQGEVGSASAMAAAGLCAALGGSNEQVENAAEIALEHHLGMTCDPIGGLVQIPCIERNAFGASKAIAAASLALRGDGCHSVSFDQVVETMRQTGLDMHSKYKETSRGGLAANVPEC